MAGQGPLRVGADEAPTTNQYVLDLVRRALDEFDDVPLEATVRRTIRIANLLGETYTALRLGFELRATGGHPPANGEATRRLMGDPSDWNVPGGVADKAVNEYIAERLNSEGLIVSHSLAEIEFWQNEGFGSDDLPAKAYGEDLGRRTKMLEIVTRARHRSFSNLCGWERQLSFAVTHERALDSVSRRVDALLNEHAPDVLSQFNAAFRRLREAVSRSNEGAANEELSQAVTSCRRILKAVVDIVHPADPNKPRSEQGHALTDEQYRNRLMEFLKGNINSASFRSALSKSGETLFDRFGSVDTLTSKGVHANVAMEEAEFCALHTYILAGEILLLHQNKGQA
ncbi:hypothetical protein ABZX12_14340 [Kribbella sp. NPDC003505]|uniref:hypothetical protein n=1 Tax=Kribbella sp. NPDC003505 TaxID=3154448 RepID=UPI0033B714D1